MNPKLKGRYLKALENEGRLEIDRRFLADIAKLEKKAMEIEGEEKIDMLPGIKSGGDLLEFIMNPKLKELNKGTVRWLAQNREKFVDLVNGTPPLRFVFDYKKRKFFVTTNVGLARARQEADFYAEVEDLSPEQLKWRAKELGLLKKS